MRKSIIGFVVAAVIIGAGCISQGFAQTPGPTVTGRLQGSTDNTQIPYSTQADGGASAVIATEGYVNRGKVQTGTGTTFAPATVREWDHLRYGGGSGTTIQLPSVATVLAGNPTGFPVHAILETTTGASTLAFNGTDKCFQGSGACPTALAANSVYILEADPGINPAGWRLIQVWRNPGFSDNAIAAIKALNPASATTADIVNALQKQ